MFSCKLTICPNAVNTDLHELEKPPDDFQCTGTTMPRQASSSDKRSKGGGIALAVIGDAAISHKGKETNS